MRRATWLVMTGALGLVAACSLTTSLSGLSGGDVTGAADGGDAASIADASGEAGATGSDGGGGDAGSTIDGGSGGYRAVVLADAPLAYYRLGDTASITAKDEVGGHDGVYKGGVTHAAGAIVGDTNAAAVFDGTSGYVDVGDVLPFTNNSPFTIEAWVSPTSAGTDPACIASKSFAQGGVSGTITNGYTLYLKENTNDVEVARYVSGVDDTIGGPIVTTGAFRHVVATYDGATLTIWLDGMSVGTGASTSDLPTFTNPLTIGASRGGIYCYFHGSLDEVAFYGAALSGDRIGAHYRAGLGK